MVAEALNGEQALTDFSFVDTEKCSLFQCRFVFGNDLGQVSIDMCVCHVFQTKQNDARQGTSAPCYKLCKIQIMGSRTRFSVLAFDRI